MKLSRKAYQVLGIAAAGALLIASLASAQVAAPGQDGRAMDANNRVGSGGLNQGNAQPGVTPNQIIYGNVTGGKRFRGPIGETDPGAFYGPTAGRFSDRFIAGSSSAPQPYQPQVDMSITQPFYGGSRAAPPPPGSVRLGYTGGYLGTSLTPGTDFGMNQFNDTSEQWRSQPLGVSTVLGTRSNVVGTPAGEAYMQGPDAENQQTIFSGSALYGIQPLRSMNPAENTYGQNQSLLNGPGDRFRIDSVEMRRMRGELENPAEQQQLQQQQQQQNGNQTTSGQQGQQSQQGQQNNPQPFGGQENTLPGANGYSNDIQSAQATQRRFTIVSPELQSSQYREMRQRLAQYENPQFVQMEAQHRARLERQVINKRLAGATSQQATPTAPNVGTPGSEAVLRKPGMGSLNTPAPIKVTSLATGVRAKGLHDMLASAEDLMRQGKFQSAIDRYNVASQIAPNNPLVSLGRANAELGAGAYLIADNDLHRVFNSDHATLVAQYDLKSWFPSERLSTVRTELQKLSAQDPKDEMPEFLLAYIAYNVNETGEAAQHLSEAKKRSGASDPLLDLLEAAWKLPATGGGSGATESSPVTRPAAPDLNK
jgi:tetratricopeptide (TPR) repeat protein